MAEHPLPCEPACLIHIIVQLSGSKTRFEVRTSLVPASHPSWAPFAVDGTVLGHVMVSARTAVLAFALKCRTVSTTASNA